MKSDVTQANVENNHIWVLVSESDFLGFTHNIHSKYIFKVNLGSQDLYRQDSMVINMNLSFGFTQNDFINA